MSSSSLPGPDKKVLLFRSGLEGEEPPRFPITKIHDALDFDPTMPLFRVKNRLHYLNPIKEDTDVIKMRNKLISRIYTGDSEYVEKDISIAEFLSIKFFHDNFGAHVSLKPGTKWAKIVDVALYYDNLPVVIRIGTREDTVLRHTKKGWFADSTDHISILKNAKTFDLVFKFEEDAPPFSSVFLPRSIYKGYVYQFPLIDNKFEDSGPYYELAENDPMMPELVEKVERASVTPKSTEQQEMKE